jgi:hypothetical protein
MAQATGFFYVNAGAQQDINILQQNDVTIQWAIQAGPIPFLLTGYTLNCYIKANAAAADGASSTVTLISAFLGQVSITLSHTATATPGTQFYHLDATLSGAVSTLAYGILTTVPI